MIQNKTYKITSNILTDDLLKSYIERFWLEVFTPLLVTTTGGAGDLKHIMILCKVKYSDTGNISYKTLGPLRRVEHKDLTLLVEYLCDRLEIINESYNPLSFNKIIFSYVIKEGKLSTSDRNLLKDLTDKSLPFHKFNKIKLPISMNPNDYGIVLGKETFIEGTETFTRYFTTVNKRVFMIDINENKLINKVTILGSSDFKWTDTVIDNDLFKREIAKSTIYFMDGEIVLQKQQLNGKPFRKGRSGHIPNK